MKVSIAIVLHCAFPHSTTFIFCSITLIFTCVLKPCVRHCMPWGASSMKVAQFVLCDTINIIQREYQYN